MQDAQHTGASQVTCLGPQPESHPDDSAPGNLAASGHVCGHHNWDILASKGDTPESDPAQCQWHWGAMEQGRGQQLCPHESVLSHPHVNDCPEMLGGHIQGALTPNQHRTETVGDSSTEPPTTLTSTRDNGHCCSGPGLGLHKPAHVHLLPPRSSLNNRGPELMADNVSH